MVLLKNNASTAESISNNIHKDSKKNKEKDVAGKPPIVFVPALFGTKLYRRRSDATSGAGQQRKNTSTIKKQQKVFIQVPTVLGLNNPDISLPLQSKEKKSQTSNDEAYEIYPGELFTGMRIGCITREDNYNKFLEHFSSKDKADTKLYTFNYDWRLDLNETTDKLVQFLSEIQTRHNGQAAQVISHSMGCLIAIAAVHTHPSVFHSAIFVGGNFAGGPGFYPMNTEGGPAGFNTKYMSGKVFQTFPSMYAGASPRNDPILKNKEDGRQMFEFVDMQHLKKTGEKVVVPIDFWDLEHWKRYHLGPWSLKMKKKVSAKMEEHVKICIQKGARFQNRVRNALIHNDSSICCENTNTTTSSTKLSNNKKYPPLAVFVGDEHLDPDFFLWDSKAFRYVPWTPKLLKEFKPTHYEKTDNTIAYCSSTHIPGLPSTVKVGIYKAKIYGDDHRKIMREVDSLDAILKDLQEHPDAQHAR